MFFIVPGRRNRSVPGFRFLLAHLSAVLPHDSNGVNSFLDETRVVHDPSHHRSVSLHRRQDGVPHPLEQDLITPRRVRYEMME